MGVILTSIVPAILKVEHEVCPKQELNLKMRPVRHNCHWSGSLAGTVPLLFKKGKEFVIRVDLCVCAFGFYRGQVVTE